MALIRIKNNICKGCKTWLKKMTATPMTTQMKTHMHVDTQTYSPFTFHPLNHTGSRFTLSWKLSIQTEGTVFCDFVKETKIKNLLALKRA